MEMAERAFLISCLVSQREQLMCIRNLQSGFFNCFRAVAMQQAWCLVLSCFGDEKQLLGNSYVPK